MQKKELVYFFLCFFMLCSTMVHGKDSDEKLKFAFSTFDVSSAGSYAYLRDGIQSMLVSRLATKERIIVLDRTFSEKELFALKNKPLDAAVGGSAAAVADYLVTGSLYGLKTGLNIQVVLYPFTAGKETLRFQADVKNQENLMNDVERLAGEIVQSTLGNKKTDSTAVKTSGDGAGVSGFVTTHPEAAYKKSVNAGAVVGMSGSGVQATAVEGKRSATLSKEIHTLATGDIDGDGIDDIVVLAGNTLEFYKLDGKKINKVATVNLPSAVECHAINMADLDNNGQMEIYVSSTEGLNVSSLIVDWDRGKGFRIVTQNIPWYIRPLFVPGKGWRLIGQRRGAEKTELVKPGIYLLDLDARGNPVQGEQLPLAPGINLFDFVFADLDGDGSAEIVAIDKKERIKVFNRANELLWVSKKNFGGSYIYLGPSRGGAVNYQDRKNFTLDEDFDRELIFVPGRLVVTDVDNDGRQEIVVNENKLSSMSIFEKMRIYDDGVIVGLAWDGTALNELWRSGTFRGYIAGFGFSVLKKLNEVGTIANKGNNKTTVSLTVGHLPSSGSLVGLLPGISETQLTIYDLEFTSRKIK